MREYNVILKRDVDYDGFWNDIESDTDGGKLYIPNRRVEFTNERPASLRQCWYLLTDEEAEQLKLDERVFDVEIPPEHRDDIIMVPNAIQTGDFTKTTSDSGEYINWGLIRSNSSSNNYATSQSLGYYPESKTINSDRFNGTEGGGGPTPAWPNAGVYFEADVVVNTSTSTITVSNITPSMPPNGIQVKIVINKFDGTSVINSTSTTTNINTNVSISPINASTTYGVFGYVLLTAIGNDYDEYTYTQPFYILATGTNLFPRYYNYTLTGKGVDVVIQDSGLQIDHPEFTDSTGVTRVQQLNWGSYSGGSFTQSANHYRDYDGHGTHVAGITAGKTYGWAKEARIYSQKLAGLEGSGDSGNGISPTYAFDAIKTWHTSKAGSRPTVVNMSWGYLDTYNTVSSVTYRGTTYTDSTMSTASNRQNNYGIRNLSGLAYGATYVCNTRVSSVDTDIQEMIDAGITVCIAAGNRSFKIDESTGTDYNNSMVTDGGTIYYHRGSSPYDDEAIMVGSLDSTSYNSTYDQKATYSETGPGVHIWAPGTDIMSACSTTNSFGASNYYWNSSYKQMNISGTSMATPQVAGVVALLYEVNPKATPAQIKSMLLANAGTAVYSTGLANDWTSTRSLQGSLQKVLYNKFNQEKTLSIGGGVSISATIKIK